MEIVKSIDIFNVTKWNYYLEEMDVPEIQEQIIDYLWKNGYTLKTAPKVTSIKIYDYINDKLIDIEVIVKDYMEE